MVNVIMPFHRITMVKLASTAMITSALAGILSGWTGQAITLTGVGAGGSPHVRAEWQLDGTRISLTYGRPSLRGRPESQMMPPGRPWRTGADAVTTLTTSGTLVFSNASLKPGAYSIFTEPGQPWYMLVGTLVPNQWGSPYRPELALFRIPMKLMGSSQSVEQVTLSIKRVVVGGRLIVEWGRTSVYADFKIEKSR